MSTARAFHSSTRLLTRQRQRAGVLAGSCLGLTIGAGMNLHSARRIRFDVSSPSASASSSFSSSSASHAFSNTPPRRNSNGKKSDDGFLTPELMKQLSSGSVTGFLSGVLVSVFSRTLVLLLGLGVVVVQVAARYGINIVDQLRLRQRLGKSRVLAALEKDPAFKLTFGIFFALSAFMQF